MGAFKKWKLSFSRSSRSRPDPPPEYICPICKSLISDPVVVKAGHTFDRICVQVCQNLSFTPTLSDGTRPDFSTQVFPNLALQSAIPNWCSQNGVAPPSPKDYAAVEKIVRGLIEEEGEKKDPIRPSEMILINGVPDKLDPGVTHPVTELNPRVNRFEFNSSSSSDESVIAAGSPMTPLPLKTKPACWSCEPSSSSSETLNPNPTAEEDEFIAKFESSDPFEQEKSAISLRKSTRTDENARISLCTPRLLQALRALLNSGYEKVQMNAIAALVNLSLEKQNKIKMVRAGIVPSVIDLLKGRLPESQEHAAGVIFSLSIEDDNKTTLGFLGALSPLMYCLTSSESERTRSDSALALYHLTLVHINRVKLVKLGAVPPLLAALQSENAGRVLLVVCNVAASAEGKAAMLDNNAVEQLVQLLRKSNGQLGSESTRENCVAALNEIGRGSMRFRALAKVAGAAEVLKEVAETGSERAREKARRVLVMLKGMQEDEEDKTLASLESVGGVSLTRHRLAAAGGAGKSSLF